MRRISVAAAVIQDGQRYFVCQRHPGKRHGGLWEFPGGKSHLGESLKDALRRELKEELGLRKIEIGFELYVGREIDSIYDIHFVEVRTSESPVLYEHLQSVWATTHELQRLPLAPMDAEFVRFLFDIEAHASSQTTHCGRSTNNPGNGGNSQNNQL
jgi:8-oxo-dGTP diphosphatase